MQKKDFDRVLIYCWYGLRGRGISKKKIQLEMSRIFVTIPKKKR